MIYCIEDDQSIRELLAYALQKEGYETRLFEDGSTLLEVISEKNARTHHFGYYVARREWFGTFEKAQSRS